MFKFDVFGAIRELLSQHGPAMAEPGDAWPCTELTAEVIRRASMFPGQFPRGGAWWKRMNIDGDTLSIWEPLFAAKEVAREIGASPIVVGPEVPETLHWLGLLAGWWLAQGWVRPLSDPRPEGHAFLVRVVVPGPDPLGYVVESSKAHGLRVNSKQWRGGDLPPVEPIRLHGSRFVAGLGFALIYPSTDAVRESQEEAVALAADSEEEDDDEEDNVGKLDIDKAERDELVDAISEEWAELTEAIKADAVTPGEVAESAFDLVLALILALIPGQVDNLAVQFFSSQIEGLKGFIGDTVDRAFGVNIDAKRLRERASRRRDAADVHIAKAEEKEEAGKSGGFFRKSPEKHRRRAAELLALAAKDELRAQEAEARSSTPAVDGV